jgi:hypothetical protein
MNNITYKARAYELHSGDVIYCDVIAMKSSGYDHKMKLGEHICIGSLCAYVTQIYKHKKYPNKKWWQFWLNQEEYIDGYNLMIL